MVVRNLGNIGNNSSKQAEGIQEKLLFNTVFYNCIYFFSFSGHFNYSSKMTRDLPFRTVDHLGRGFNQPKQRFGI